LILKSQSLTFFKHSNEPRPKQNVVNLQSGVKCVQLDGSMTMAAREAAIARFTNEGDCRIFLMSLKAGRVALNLTIASHVRT
jgi:SNF2 family DNA or RNA helicase